MERKLPRVLISPLNWGLGHATRCIPLIRSLIANNAYIMLAGNGESFSLLKKEFPLLDNAELPGIVIRYGSAGMSLSKLLSQIPAFLYNMRREHKKLEILIKENAIDIVISDNRYGLWSRKCHTVFITHQLYIKLPHALKWIEPVLNKVIEKMILKFDECWVPDNASSLISGDLSMQKKNTIPVKYIGILSRFNHDKAPLPDSSYEVLVILSGPEPQRSILEQKIIAALNRQNLKSILVRGLIASSVSSVDGVVHLIDNLTTPELHRLLLGSKYIICRAGYSSLMDLAAVKRNAIIIPTPGQTEQEYLGNLHHMKHHYCMLQDEIDLDKAFDALPLLEPFASESFSAFEISELLTPFTGNI